MTLYETRKIVKRRKKLLAGLRCIGMSIAAAVAKKVKIVCFDSNSKKMGMYKWRVNPYCFTHEAEKTKLNKYVN